MRCSSKKPTSRLLLLSIALPLSATCIGQTIPPVDVVPDGALLTPGTSCYTITATNNQKEQPIGHVLQTIEAQRADGIDLLAIVVHQHLTNGTFDMRDRFLLRKSDLRPLRLDTDRNGAPHVHLDYTANHVVGWKMVNNLKTQIDIAFDRPVWEGNLWGLTFAALPLKENGNYQLPTYQYDSGVGHFLVSVSGERKITTPAGAVESWVLRAGIKSDELVEYLVAQNPRLELGYAAGPMSQHLGGDCDGLR